MKIETYSKTFFRCPCGPEGEEFALSHLNTGDKAGPWTCMSCGTAYDVWVPTYGDWKITKSIERQQGTRRNLVLLKMRPAREVYLLVRGYHHPNHDGPTDTYRDSSRYYYEEGTCPTNFLQEAKLLVVDDDADPHGSFEYLGETLRDPGDRPDLDFIQEVFGVPREKIIDVEPQRERQILKEQAALINMMSSVLDVPADMLVEPPISIGQIMATDDPQTQKGD